jgi:stage IV sporulation protein FB
MAWSFPIARLFGSELRVHVTFFILLLWIGIANYQQGGTEAAIGGILFILALFACVIAHEFGHALAARRYGIHTPDITLLPIGGMARLERLPEKPSEEIVVALAGPAVNIVIALVLFGLLGARFDMNALATLDDPQGSFLARLAAVNIFLVLFNMIPAFPMDGGRVLRAVLATFYPRSRATRIAARIGQGFAFFLGFIGLLGNPLLIFIAIFVYIAATAESQATELQEVSRNIGVRDAMITRFEALPADATIGDAADALLRTTQAEFPVLDEHGTLLGFVTRHSMIQVLGRSGKSAPARAAMVADIPLVGIGDRLETALTAMQKSGAPAIGVRDKNGRFAGYITPENIGELVMLESSVGRL